MKLVNGAFYSLYFGDGDGDGDDVDDNKTDTLRNV